MFEIHHLLVCLSSIGVTALFSWHKCLRGEIILCKSWSAAYRWDLWDPRASKPKLKLLLSKLATSFSSLGLPSSPNQPWSGADSWPRVLTPMAFSKLRFPSLLSLGWKHDYLRQPTTALETLPPLASHWDALGLQSAASGWRLRWRELPSPFGRQASRPTRCSPPSTAPGPLPLQCSPLAHSPVHLTYIISPKSFTLEIHATSELTKDFTSFGVYIFLSMFSGTITTVFFELQAFKFLF